MSRFQTDENQFFFFFWGGGVLYSPFCPDYTAVAVSVKLTVLSRSALVV